MNHYWKISVIPIAMLAFAGCATQRMKEASAAKEQKVTIAHSGYAGTVRMVTVFKFVVLNLTGIISPPVGTVMEVVRDGEKVGRVKTDAPSQEHPTLMTADILEGTPQNGDYVRLEGADKPISNDGTASKNSPPARRQNFGPR